MTGILHWPVSFTLGGIALLELGHHDNVLWGFLPNQPPKVNDSVLQGSYVQISYIEPISVFQHNHTDTKYLELQ